MAQLKDTIIDGVLRNTSDIILGGKLYSIHPATGDNSSMIHMDSAGNTIIGHDGCSNDNGNTYICGKDVSIYVGSDDNNFRPYYKSGDTIPIEIRVSGHCVNRGTDIRFHVPLSKPVIGSPDVTVESKNGFILFQDGQYTHDSTATTWVKPSNESGTLRSNGVEIYAVMSTTTNAITLAPIGIIWSGTITFK